MGRTGRYRLVHGTHWLLQQQRSKFARVLDPHAAVALTPVVACEQALQRRVMQVDIKRIRHLKFELAERTACPGTPQERPIGLEHHVMVRQVAWIGALPGQDFPDRDLLRDVPGRVEQDTLDLRLHFRSLLVGLTDDHAPGEYRHVATEQQQLRARSIDLNSIRRHGSRQPT
jgi:hypothetical protein